MVEEVEEEKVAESLPNGFVFQLRGRDGRRV